MSNHVFDDEKADLQVEKNWEEFFLSGGSVSDDFMPERAGQEQEARETL